MINLRNPREYIETFLRIRTKDGQEIKLTLKPAQLKLYAAVKAQADAGKPVRVIVLKARQMGFSTLISALLFHACATQENRAGLFLAHVSEATANLHAMHKRFFDGLPARIRPMRAASNATELKFENPTKNTEDKKRQPGLRSRLRCATAGGSGVGRSDTLQYVHASEFAFWPDGITTKADILTGILQAVPALPGTMVFIESTAKGYDEFHRLWEDAVEGRSDFVPVFFPWFEEPDYRRPVPPGTVWTQEERDIQTQFGLCEEQLAWRRWSIQNNCGGDLEKFHQEYPATPEEAFIASGSCWFQLHAVQARLAELQKHPVQGQRRGSFDYTVRYDAALQDVTLENVRFVDNPQGAVTIFRQPEPGAPYVLGGDTAGEGSDWFGAYVIDNRDCSMCAVLHQKYDEKSYALQVFCLGQYFNQALVGLEVNFSTYPTRKLEQMGYKKLYVREHPDTYKGTHKSAFGYRTDGVTRPAMLAECREIFEAKPEAVCHEALLREMLTFVKDKNGRPAALEGEHDDLVMSWAITLKIRIQQRTTTEPPKGKRVAWTKDMWEDWNHADAAEREELTRMWGRPY